ncbi:MAG TPA: CAP domain-containing protein [Acidimicrobiia bacterium]|nr:CAP domain-containing protein [Acidimicrobiia bacterium]
MRKLVLGLILAFGVSLLPVGTAHADTVSDEASFVAKINDLRISQGLPALVVNDNLVAKARAWAAGMATAGKIWHSTLSDGITADWKKLGENVGMGGSVDGLHNAFVASPHHYENLVDPAFGFVGIGIAMSGSTIFVAEEFMQLMPARPVVSAVAPVVGTVAKVLTPATPPTTAPKPAAPKPPAVKPAAKAPAPTTTTTTSPPPPAPPAVTAPPVAPPTAPTWAPPVEPQRIPSDLLLSVLDRLHDFDR